MKISALDQVIKYQNVSKSEVNFKYRNKFSYILLNIPAGSTVLLEDCASDDDNGHQRWVYHNVNLKLQDYPHLCMDATTLGSFKFQPCNNGDSQHFLFEMLNV